MTEKIKILSINDLKQKEKNQIKTAFEEAWTTRSQWTGFWDQLGIYANVPKQNFSNIDSSFRGQSLDEELNDSSVLIGIEQATDSIHGILIGDVENLFTLEPTESVLDSTDSSETLKEYYDWASKNALFYINRPKSNFSPTFKATIRDQVVLGTSGIGSFYDKNYLEDKKGNILSHRPFGLDIMAIDEGENGLPDYVYLKYNWRISRIVNTFAVVNGKLDDKKFEALPDEWKKAYKKPKTDQRFSVYYTMMPNSEFKMGKIGKVGSEYVGVWCDDKFETFLELEFYSKKPIPIGRMSKRRSEMYGRSNLSNILSTVQMLQYIMGDVFECVEKIVKPAMAMYNGALVGDKIIDMSSNGVNVLNPTLAGKNPPLFPLLEVGDITPLISFLVPLLKEQIARGLKIDSLLDLESTKRDVTATEALRRYAIRSKAILGMLTQIKNELLTPILERDIDLLMKVGELGVDPEVDKKEAQSLIERKRGFRVIPQAVLDHIKKGKEWFKIRYNTELSMLAKGKDFEALSNFLLILQAISNFNPKIIAAIDWYKVTSDTKDTLGVSSDFLKTEDEYNEQIAKEQQLEALQGGANLGEIISKINKNQSESTKNETESKRK